jgi:flagellar biosynthesis protein FliR
MAEVKQLEIDLWAVLQQATAVPEEAEFPVIWQALDQVLPGLAIVEQLQMAAMTIAQVADIFQVQAGLIFEELDATATQEGPRMAADAFDRYVRQYMTIAFEDYIEEPEALPRMARSVRVDEDEFYSVVESVEKEELLEVLHDEMVMSEAEAHAAALAVAHGEDISEWIAAIETQLAEVGTAIEFQALLRLVNLHFIELWLGLLLGGYELQRVQEEFEQDEDFYSEIGILVQV